MDWIGIIRERTQNAMLAFPKPKELNVKSLTEFVPRITTEEIRFERSNALFEIYEKTGE